MPTVTANSSNFPPVSSATTATLVIAKTALSSSPKQPSEQPKVTLPGGGAQNAEPARQILPAGKANAPEPGSEEVKAVVDKLNSQIKGLQRDLSFSVDEASGRTVIKVIDSQTAEVVRQIPSAEVLRLSQQLDAILSQANEQVSGLLVEVQA